MAEKTPFHQWTDEKGRVLIVKCLNKDGTSHNGFMWPKSGKVAIPKNSTKNDCESGGLFGWAWGIGVGDGKDPNACSPWLVFAAKPEHVIVVEDGPKVKACVSSEDAEVEVVYYGDMATAMYITSQQRVAWVMHNSDGKASATGEMGSASATGWSGSASATGWRGSASATGGNSVAAVTNEYCTVEVGADGIAAACAEEVFWRIRKGAVLIQRWGDAKKSKTAVIDSATLKKFKDGDLVKVLRGKVTKA